MSKLVSRLTVIGNAANSEMSAALIETADFIIGMIRVFAPVDTGRLRDSYKKQILTPLHIVIGSMVLYSIYQEFGTSRQRGTPHVIPAFLQGESHFNKVVAKRMSNL